MTQKQNKKAVLSRREARDAAINFDTYRILQELLSFHVRLATRKANK